MSGLSLTRAIEWLTEAELLEGQPREIGTPVDDVIESACVDSRLATVRSLFVALPGERTDGHLYVDDAVNRGAVAAIVQADRLNEVVERVYGSVRLFPVGDPLAALQLLARRWRECFPDLTRVCITGSNGKTTTKELIAAILSAAASTVSSRGNYNSDIGMPVELLRIRGSHVYGVFEAGMNRPGEIAELVAMLQPDISVITNIGTAHIGMVGSRDRIAQEKKAVFSSFSGDQTAIVPSAGDYVEFLSDGVSGRVVHHGAKAAGVVRVGAVSLSGTKLGLVEGEIELALPGEHMVENALAAITVARVLDIPFDAIRAGVESVRPTFARSEIVEGRATVIQDCYNANPESMESAIALLGHQVGETPSVAILGAMKELGDDSEELHRSVFTRALESGVDEIWLVGAEFEFARAAGATVRWFADDQWDELYALAAGIPAGTTVLLKGSRLMELERLTPVIQHTVSVSSGVHRG